MKNIKIFTLLFSLLFIVSCNEEEYTDYTAPDDLTDISWLIGFDPNSAAKFKINADTQVPFFNLAQGALSSEWIIEEGNHFLNTGFKTNDTLENFINEGAGLSITDGKAFVLFKNSGLNTVRLINKFDKPVSPNITGRDSLNIIVDSYEENGQFVLDTKFIFDVYAKIQPAFSIFKDGNEILNVTIEDNPKLSDSSTWPVVEIEAATALSFVDNTSIGRPSRAIWVIPEGVPSQPTTPAGGTANIKFYKLGTFNVGTFRSVRSPDSENEVPRFSIDKLIPLKVKVIQSSQPFIFDGALTENENEVMQFRVNGEAIPFAGQEGGFTVNVKNPAAGFDQDIPVQTARVKEGDATFIELILSAPIYNSDDITVSYNGAGIVSADDRILQPFGPAVVKMNLGDNIIPEKAHASFEEESGAANRAFALNYFTGNNNILDGGNFAFERVTTKSFAGNASMKWSTLASDPVPNVNLWSFGIARIAPIPAGTYQMSYHIFVEPGTTLKTFRTEFNKPAFSRQIWNIESLPKGEWVKVSNTVTTDEITPGDNLRFTFRPHEAENVGVTGAQLLYIDNLTFIEIEVRP